MVHTLNELNRNVAPLIDDKLRLKEHGNFVRSATFAHNEATNAFARQCAQEVGLNLIDGPYNVWPLPNFETAADIQFTKEAGSLASGASTVPEQLAASFLGVKCIGFAAVTNPASGTTDGWVHDGEHNLIAAKKCLEGLKKVIWRIVEKFEFNSGHKLNLNYSGANALKLKQTPHHPSEQEISAGIATKVR